MPDSWTATMMHDDVVRVLDEADVSVNEAAEIIRRLEQGLIEGHHFRTTVKEQEAFSRGDYWSECGDDDDDDDVGPDTSLRIGCLIGTIAILRGVSYEQLGIHAGGRWAETLFGEISYSDTPDDNESAALAVKWIAEWVSKREEMAVQI